MIENGIVQLVQADAIVTSLCAAGGYYAQLPEDQRLPCWSYLFVSDVADYTLLGMVALTMRRLQVDCYGASGADAIGLADAIDRILSGYKGVLPDPENTVVQGCFRSNLIDFFDSSSRSFRRMLEYTLWFNQS